jgi:drug/metabolite transporter (DMT)-like permease
VTELAEPLPGVEPAPHARPARGYLLYLGAATLFAVNGTVVKSILLTGVAAGHLSQLRVTGAFLVLLVALLIARPRTVPLRRAEVPLLLVYGVLGVAATQFLYFVSITLLPIGLALLIEFTAPIMVALWFRFGLHHPTKPAVWVALLLAVIGLAIVSEAWQEFTLDPWGVVVAFGAAVTLAIYYVTADMQVRGPRPRDPVSLTMWGMGAAALAWAIALPWWTYPWGEFAGSVALGGGAGPMIPLWALAAWMIVLGTVAPFSLVVLSLRHLRASQASVMGMTEPVIATAIAWVVLDEVLTPYQIVGSAIVLGAVLLAERNR